MNCSDFQRRVPLYPDRSLSSSDRAALDEHAAVCPLCAPALRIFRVMRAGFSALPSVGASDEFERRVLRRVDRAREERSGGIIEFPAWGRPVAVAIAAALLLFVGWQAVRRDATGVRREVATNLPGRAQEAPPAVRTVDDERARASVADPGTSAPAEPQVAATSRDARAARSETLDLLLGEGGVALAPPGSGRKYVIDRPTDLPRLLSQGAEGELASTPISF